MSMTVHLPDEIARRLAAEAARQGRSVDELLAELVAAQLPEESPRASRRQLAFAGIGASTSGRSAAEAKEMLAEGFGRD
ncbi:MAG: ribbon-helix-helix protein, CopG family [Acidimicrobiia bacterium]